MDVERSVDIDYRDTMVIQKLLMSRREQKPGQKQESGLRIVEVTAHGEAPATGETFFNENGARRSRPPVVTVLPNIMIIITNVGGGIGQEIYTSAAIYNMLLSEEPPGWVRPATIPHLKGNWEEKSAVVPELPPPNIVNLFASLLGIRQLKAASEIGYYTPDEPIGNRKMELNYDDVFLGQKNPELHRPRSAMFGVYEVEDRVSRIDSGLTHKLADKKYFSLDNLQHFINERYKPTAANPVCIVVISCDVSRKEKPVPDRDYIDAMTKRTNYHSPKSVIDESFWKRPCIDPGILRLHSEAAALWKGILFRWGVDATSEYLFTASPHVNGNLGLSRHEPYPAIVTSRNPKYSRSVAEIYEPPLEIIRRAPRFHSSVVISKRGERLKTGTKKKKGVKPSWAPIAHEKMAEHLLREEKERIKRMTVKNLKEKISGGHLKKSQKHRSKRRCPRSTSQKKTGSKRGSRSLSR